MTTTRYLESYNETPQKPPGPKAGLWSLRYLDPLTGVRLRFNKTIRQLYNDFPDVLPPGTPFPGFDLETTTGERINTQDLIGKKHLVLMTGAITWPPFRRQLPLFEQLRAKYADRDVAIVHIYVREPHPEERAFKNYTQHTSYEQKMAYARELVELKAVTVPVVVDEMDEATNQLLGGLPNTIWVIDKTGDVRYKSSWADVDKADKALAELVTADDPANPVEPTFATQDVSDKI